MDYSFENFSFLSIHITHFAWEQSLEDGVEIIYLVLRFYFKNTRMSLVLETIIHLTLFSLEPLERLI